MSSKQRKEKERREGEGKGEEDGGGRREGEEEGGGQEEQPLLEDVGEQLHHASQPFVLAGVRGDGAPKHLLQHQAMENSIA
jgi:hypothetical protein